MSISKPFFEAQQRLYNEQHIMYIYYRHTETFGTLMNNYEADCVGNGEKTSGTSLNH